MDRPIDLIGLGERFCLSVSHATSYSHLRAVLRRAVTYLVAATAVNTVVALTAGFVRLDSFDVFLTLAMAVGVLLLGLGYLLDTAASPRGRETQRVLMRSQKELTEPQLNEMRAKADALALSGAVLVLIGFLVTVTKTV